MFESLAGKRSTVPVSARDIAGWTEATAPKTTAPATSPRSVRVAFTRTSSAKSSEGYRTIVVIGGASFPA